MSKKIINIFKGLIVEVKIRMFMYKSAQPQLTTKCLKKCHTDNNNFTSNVKLARTINFICNAIMIYRTVMPDEKKPYDREVSS